MDEGFDEYMSEGMNEPMHRGPKDQKDERNELKDRLDGYERKLI